MPIFIANRKTNDIPSDAISFYVGRPSALGNPFVMEDDSDEERGRVCAEYGRWLQQRLEEGDKEVTEQVESICRVAHHNAVYLECWCFPKRCHAEEIRDVVYERLGMEKTYQKVMKDESS